MAFFCLSHFSGYNASVPGHIATGKNENVTVRSHVATGKNENVTSTSHIVTGPGENVNLTNHYVIVHRYVEAVLTNDE